MGLSQCPLVGTRYAEQPVQHTLVSFTSPLGSYSFLRLPLGIKPAAAIFSRELNSTLREWLYRDLVTFVDDVSMAHHDKTKHIQVLVDVVDRLAGRGYSVRPSKCDFLARALTSWDMCVHSGVSSHRLAVSRPSRRCPCPTLRPRPMSNGRSEAS